MTTNDIKEKLATNISNAKVFISGDGCNCSALIISPSFVGLSLLARQKMILSIMRDAIESGELHALSIKAYTPAEAEKLQINEQEVN